MRSARLLRHLSDVRMRLISADSPFGPERREAEAADPRGAEDWALLDLLTAAVDMADDKVVQTLAAYARTSLILHLTRRASR